MARSRNIKPGFFKNADLVDLPAFTRLLFAGLWCLADREGRLEDRPKQIKIELLPADNCDVEEMLVSLAVRGFIERYEVDGQKYINLPNFHKHQKPHFKEVPSTLPPPKPLPRQVLAPTQVGADHDLGSGKQQPRSVPTTTQVVASPADSLNLIPDVLIPDSLSSDCPAPRRSALLGRGAQGQDDKFDEFKMAGIDAGVDCSNADWEESRPMFNRSGFEAQLRAAAGYRERMRLKAVDDPALKALPKNYLERQMYDRGIRLPTARTTALSSIDRQAEIIQRKERERNGAQ